MKPTLNPSPRDELSEPLRSLIEDMANAPVPEDLIPRARQFVIPVSEPPKRQRSVMALVVSVLALSLCIAAFIFRGKPPEQPRQFAKETPLIPSQPPEELPPPTLWAYHQAYSAEDLDELLSRHASVLLPPSSNEDLHPFQPFSRKEEL